MVLEPKRSGGTMETLFALCVLRNSGSSRSSPLAELVSSGARLAAVTALPAVLANACSIVLSMMSSVASPGTGGLVTRLLSRLAALGVGEATSLTALPVAGSAVDALFFFAWNFLSWCIRALDSARLAQPGSGCTVSDLLLCPRSLGSPLCRICIVRHRPVSYIETMSSGSMVL